jgi:glycosyltransferase involved in cell wall biosynthesis
MRWMLLTETYLPELNGVTITLSKLTEGLIARGHQVHIVRPRQGRDDKPIAHPANPGHTLVWSVPLFWVKGIRLGMPYLGQLKNEIKKFKPDILHVATEGWLGFAGVTAAHAYKIPVVSSYHTNFFAYSRFYGLGFLRTLGYWYFRLAHNATLKTFVPSQTVLRQLQSYKFKNLEIMSRGVETDVFSPAHRSEELRRSWGVGPDDIVMFYNGRIAPEKNFPLMLKCYERLKKIDPNARLVIAGGSHGSLKEKLQREHPEIIFTGVITGLPRSQHYASADLFVFSSSTETYGNVILEAMSSALVVLAYDYAAPRENIVDGVNGFLAPFKKENEFISRFDEILKKRSEWKKIAAAARESVKDRSWDNVVDKYIGSIRGLKG